MVGLFGEVLRENLSPSDAAALVVINLCEGRCASKSGRQELCKLTQQAYVRLTERAAVVTGMHLWSSCREEWTDRIAAGQASRQGSWLQGCVEEYKAYLEEQHGRDSFFSVVVTGAGRHALNTENQARFKVRLRKGMADAKVVAGRGSELATAAAGFWQLKPRPAKALHAGANFLAVVSSHQASTPNKAQGRRRCEE